MPASASLVTTPSDLDRAPLLQALRSAADKSSCTAASLSNLLTDTVLPGETGKSPRLSCQLTEELGTKEFSLPVMDLKDSRMPLPQQSRSIIHSPTTVGR